MKLRWIILLGGVFLAVPAGYVMLRSASATAESAAVVNRGQPKCVIDHTTHDFGVMDVGESATHVFVVRNEGVAPLTMTVIDTSCKCTLLDAPKGEIAPGESRELKLEWKTIEPIDGFRHGGTLSTNDPDHQVIKVFVEGKVRARVRSQPETVVFNSVLSGESREAQALIISQVWDQFSVETVECTLAGVKVAPWKFDPELLKGDAWARSAQGLQFSLTADMPIGTHRGLLKYRVRTSKEEQAREQIHELPIVVEVVTPFTIHGRSVEANAMVLGPIARGKGKKESALVLARNAPPDFEVRNVRVQPDLLKVSLRRTDQKTGNTARYAFDVEVPADAPPINCMTPNVAVVTLESNYPKFPEVRFYVEFAVID